MSKTDNDIKKMIKIQESINNRKLTEKEIRKIEKKIKRINKLENAFRGILVALGFGVGIAGTKFLEAGKGEKNAIVSEFDKEELSKNKEKEEFLEGLKYDSTKIVQNQEKQEGVLVKDYKKDFGYIVKKYNEIYGTNLNINDFGILESNPELLTRTYNEQGEIVYIQDFDDYNGISDDKELIKGEEFHYKSKVVINRNTLETVFGVAEINGKIQALDVKKAKKSDGKIYKENPDKGNINIFEDLTDKEKEELYNSIQDRYNEILAEQYSKTNNDDYHEPYMY